MHIHKHLPYAHPVNHLEKWWFSPIKEAVTVELGHDSPCAHSYFLWGALWCTAVVSILSSRIIHRRNITDYESKVLLTWPLTGDFFLVNTEISRIDWLPLLPPLCSSSKMAPCAPVCLIAQWMTLTPFTFRTTEISKLSSDGVWCSQPRIGTWSDHVLPTYLQKWIFIFWWMLHRSQFSISSLMKLTVLLWLPSPHTQLIRLIVCLMRAD